MGTDAALLTHKVLENAYIVVAIELIALAQAVDFLNISDQISTESKNLYKFIRSHIRKIESDRELQSELATFLTALKNF
jgi:histidine ammonia-lyase